MISPEVSIAFFWADRRGMNIIFKRKNRLQNRQSDFFFAKGGCFILLIIKNSPRMYKKMCDKKSKKNDLSFPNFKNSRTFAAVIANLAQLVEQRIRNA